MFCFVLRKDWEKSKGVDALELRGALGNVEEGWVE